VKVGIERMIRKGQPAAIFALMTHPDRDTREAVAREIARIEDPNKLNRLAEMLLPSTGRWRPLTEPPHISARRSARRLATRFLPCPNLRLRYLRLRSDLATYNEVRSAAQPLSACVGPLFGALQDAGAPATEAMLYVLTWCFHRTSRLRVPVKLDTFAPWWGRQEAVASRIAALGREGIDFLLGAIADSDWVIRAAAASGLALATDARASTELTRLLRDPESVVRSAAAAALAAGMHKESITALIGVLLHDDTESVRVSAVQAVGQLGGGIACDALMLALERDLSIEVRLSAGDALAQLKDARALEPLLDLFQCGESATCTAAAQALGKLGDSRALPPLLSILSTGRGEDPSYPTTIPAIIWAVGEIGEYSAGPALCKILADTEGDRQRNAASRRSAAEALGRIGYLPAGGLLVQTVLDETGDLWRAAALALGQLGCKEAIPALAQVLSTSKLRGADGMDEAAIAALVAQYGEPATAALTPMLSTTNRLLRLRAAKALKAGGWVPRSEEEAVPFFIALGEWDALRELEPEAVRGQVKTLIEEFFSTVRIPFALSQSANELKRLGWAHVLTAEVIDLLVDAASYHRVTRRSSLISYKTEVSLVESNRAVRALCRRKGAAVSNLLYLIATRKHDQRITVESCFGDDLRESSEVVPFAKQRDMARASLKRRRFSGYDPRAYFP